MAASRVHDRLLELERRLDRLEAHFGLEPLPPVVQPEPAIIAPPPLPVVPIVETFETPLEVTPRSFVAPPPVVFPPPVPMEYSPRITEKLSKQPSQAGLEQAIGLKWAGWIGAIVLVIGAGLGIKFAYDNHWFDIVSPAVRLVLMSLVGFVLILAGEWVFRRVNTLSAVGLFGSGVAVLFLVSFAGHRFYGLYARETAYALTALATLVGASVAVRGNLVSIAVLSLIGGNLAPLLLGGDTEHTTPFLTYLLMLQVVALFLAWWGRGGKWWTLRGLSLATTSLWMAGLIGTHVDQPFASQPLIFILIYAALYHVELIASAARLAWLTRINGPMRTVEMANPGVLFSALVTGAALAAVLWIFSGASNHFRGMVVLGFAAACAVMGVLLVRREPSPMRTMSVGYRVQAALLLIVAIPAGLSGISIEFGWAILAVMFGLLARVLRVRISRVAALATWGLAVAHLLSRAAESLTAVKDVWITLLGYGIPQYAVIGWGLALLGHVVAWCIIDVSPRGGDPAQDDDQFDRYLSAAATLLVIVVSIAALPSVGATLALVIYGWLLVIGDFTAVRLGMAVQSIVVLVLATVKWAIVDTLIERFAPAWSPLQYAAVFNPVMGMGILIAISLAGLGWLRRRPLAEALKRWSGGTASEREVILLIAGMVILLMVVGLSFEIDRAAERASALGAASAWPYGQVKHLAWTMLWTVAVCLFLAMVLWIEPDRQRRLHWLRQVWALPIGLSIKFLIIDSLGYRLTHGPASTPILFNLQGLTAAVLVGGLIMTWFVADSREDTSPASPGKTFGRTATALTVLALLWTGSLEIDRYFETTRTSLADPHLAKEVALSIFWALFAVGSVIAGFRIRAASVRYFGLGLFALTLIKVFFVDLGNVSGGYRVLSFLGLGLLLLGTSVLYGKLSPHILKSDEAAPSV